MASEFTMSESMRSIPRECGAASSRDAVLGARSVAIHHLKAEFRLRPPELWRQVLAAADAAREQVAEPRGEKSSSRAVVRSVRGTELQVLSSPVR